MKKTIAIFGLLTSAFLLQSCGYGHSINQNFTPLDAATPAIVCETPPENVELVFEGEKINFEYEKIGIIEIQGESFSNDKEVLEKIRLLTKSKCCDAIINLKRTYTDRDSGILFTPEYDHKYSAITYHGIAVRKKTNNQVSELQNQLQ